MQRFLNQLIPFLLLGIAIVAFVLGIMLLAYLFLFGAIVGLILFVIAWIRQKFFPAKTVARTKKRTSGRIIDSDDWKKL
ncbi:hypothetical protein [Aquicella lusitana]|uniref:Uncharacterized protein n=1 Tax=Aquicella lusitana TaxID=254246 RepID=A0A370GT73_9COXI|nr:hypothetical protein [Aquicella lusitana]RDI46520.1 hypothetical protein C8D86_10544 [Aquicella lusitana]VVC74184.1 hypothetical protein AQULUS_19490 [Aquicella lusitana]